MGWESLIQMPSFSFVESSIVIDSLYVGVRSAYQLSHDLWCVLGGWSQRYWSGFQLFLTFLAFAYISLLLLPMEISDRQVARRDWRHIFSYAKIPPSKYDAIEPFMMNESLYLRGMRLVVPSYRLIFLSLINFQVWCIQDIVIQWERAGNFLSNSLPKQPN